MHALVVCVMTSPGGALSRGAVFICHPHPTMVSPSTVDWYWRLLTDMYGVSDPARPGGPYDNLDVVDFIVQGTSSRELREHLIWLSSRYVLRAKGRETALMDELKHEREYLALLRENTSSTKTTT